MRVFIAIELNEEVRIKAAQAQESLKLIKGVKWVESENFHLTLKFLGETDQGLVSRLANDLRAIAGNTPAFILEFGGAGVFPNEKRPRVVWIGIKDGLDALFALAQKTEEICQHLGFEMESRPFSAHLTLGRIKFPEPMPALIEQVHKLENESFGSVKIDHLTIMESSLTPKGPIYKPLHKITLAEIL